MKIRLIRILAILACGIVMALVAYVGQAGDAPGAASSLAPGSAGRSVRLVMVDGLQLDYRLTTPDPDDPESGPELSLHLAGPVLGADEEAVVTYRMLGPRGTELQAWARPGRVGYAADIHLDFPGRYQIAVEIIAVAGTFNDRFEYYRP